MGNRREERLPGDRWHPSSLFKTKKGDPDLHRSEY